MKNSVEHVTCGALLGTNTLNCVLMMMLVLVLTCVMLLLCVSLCNQLLSIIFKLWTNWLTHIEDKRLNSACLISAAVIDLLNEITLPLNRPIGHLTDLLRVENFPGLIVQVFIKWHDENGVHKVDESVTNVAHIVQILW